MSTYLVTGGAGFIGSHVVDALIEQGHSVRVIDNLSSGKRAHVNARAEFFEVDILDLDELKTLFSGIDGVFHLAAIPSIPYSIEHPKESFEVNVNGTLHVLLAAKDSGVKRVVYSASASVYGDTSIIPTPCTVAANPLSPYALQKYLGELLVRQFSDVYGLETVRLRYFNVYGPRAAQEGAYVTVMSIFRRLKEQGKPLSIIGDGMQTRDFVHVKDVAQANVAAMFSERVGRGEVFNVATGKQTTVLDVARLFGGDIAFIPPRQGEIIHSCADIRETVEMLDWKPRILFEEGVRELLV
jgi:UDP-glucose 4-epimerase